MWRFLIDEDMSRLTANALREAGYTAVDVRDIGLRGHSDLEIFERAQFDSAVIVTADKDFSNILRFPLGTPAGIIVVRVSDELPTSVINQELLRALNDLGEEELIGALVIVEIGRTRIRRPAKPHDEI